MATKIGDLFFDVTANTAQATADLAKFAGITKANMSAAGKAIGSTVANGVAIAVGGLGILTTAVISAGNEYNTLGQSATAAFSTIYDSAVVAYDILRDISELALSTPFEGAALVRASRILAGFGVAEEDLIGLTTALTEATAAIGLGNAELGRIAIAFGQIQSRGKLAGDEARQLANYGIDAFGLLADRIGLSVAEVRKLGEEGKLAADFVIPALVDEINERFGGATEALFNTVAGQLSGLRSTVQGIGSALVEPFIGFSGGGAVVEGIQSVRLALNEFIEVGTGGSFKLVGALEPLNGILDSIAAKVSDAGERFAGFLAGLDGSDVSGLIDTFRELGPIAAAVGAGLGTAFASAIPIIGRLFAGFNPIVVGIATLIAVIPELREAFQDSFGRIVESIDPLLPKIQELFDNLIETGVVESSLNLIAVAFEEAAPLALELVDAVNVFINDAGPGLAAIIDVVALALQLFGEIVEVVGPELTLLATALGAVIYFFPVLTAQVALATTNFSAIALGASATASAVLGLAAALGIAAAAFASYNSIKAGITGDVDYLNRDVAFFEKPFQLAGRFGFALGGGDREEAQFIEEFDAAALAAEQFDLRLLASAQTAEDARAIIDQYGVALGVSAEQADFFGNKVQNAWTRAREAEEEAAAVTLAHQNSYDTWDGVLEELRAAIDENNEVIAVEVDLMKQLTAEADAAWEAVERLGDAGANGGIDDFLRSLPDIGEELTGALDGGGGLLQDLNVRGITDELRSGLVEAITAAAREGGTSLDQIRELFDARGLVGVMEELGIATVETTEKVDPLVAKYSELGAGVDELKEAISQLNEERTDRLNAEIDALEAGLRGAEDAADAAREALDNFLNGNYSGTQAAVDDLFGQLDKFGSDIEAGKLLGGALGDAQGRSALGDFNSAVADVYRTGAEEGLSGVEIAALLGPLASGLDQVVGQGANRISSLDFTEGITPEAGQALRDALAKAQGAAGEFDFLVGNLNGAEAAIANFQSSIDAKRVELQTDVEFSQEQIQSKLNEIDVSAETSVIPVISDEAIDILFAEIAQTFEDEDLKLALDEANFTQQILDAARDAENSLVLELTTNLNFNPGQLLELADIVGGEFATAFRRNLAEQILAESTLQGGNLEAELAAIRAGNTAGSTPPPANNTFNSNITITSGSLPRQTASEIVAAQAAASSSGGRLDLQAIYGTPPPLPEGGGAG